MLRYRLDPQPHSNIIVPSSYLQVFEGNATSDKVHLQNAEAPSETLSLHHHQLREPLAAAIA